MDSSVVRDNPQDRPAPARVFSGEHDHADLPDGHLLIRRPHLRLREHELLCAYTGRPRGVLSGAEVQLWHLMLQPVPVQLARQSCPDAVILEFLRKGYCDVVESEFPRGRRRVIVIEPHADDAAFSIGGTMWEQRLETEFLVATMASRSNHTRYRNIGSGLFDVEQVSEIRRLESELFARLVGGSHVSVGLTDAELRYHDTRWTPEYFRRYDMSIRVSTSRIADDRELELWTDAVRRLLADHPSAEVWFPLGGPHADHMLTADACHAAFLSDPSLAKGRVLRIYSDYPYALRYPRQMDAALAALRRAGAVLEESRISVKGSWQNKLRLASVYDSQEIEEMPRDDESAVITRGAPAGQTEVLLTLHELPGNIDYAGIVSAAVAGPAHVEAVTAWVARNRDAKSLRVLLLLPTGRWSADLELLCAAFPRARIEVDASRDAAAEVADVPSPRVDLRILSGGAASWIRLALGISAGMRAGPTLFHVGPGRLRHARMLSRLWPRSDTLVLESMNPLMRALRAPR